eukprot:3491688-Pyramimonas_sp.AAC.1
MAESHRKSVKNMRGLADVQQRRREQAIQRQKDARRDLTMHARQLAMPDGSESQEQSTTQVRRICNLSELYHAGSRRIRTKILTPSPPCLYSPFAP